MSELEQLLDEKSVALEGVDEVEVERESLAILATLRTTKEYLSKDMTLADVHRLSKKDVRKYYKMYQMVNGQQVCNTLVKGSLGIFSKVVSHIIPIDSLATDLREGRLVQRELSTFAGYMVLREGRLIVLASAILQVAMHNEIMVKPNTIEKEDSIVQEALESN